MALSKGGPSYLKLIINEMEYPDTGKNVTRALFEIFWSAPAVQLNDNTMKYKQVAEHKWVEIVPTRDVNTERSVWWVDGFEAAAIKYLGYTNPGRVGAAMWLSAFVNRETLFESNLQQSDFCTFTVPHMVTSTGIWELMTCFLYFQGISPKRHRRHRWFWRRRS
jgi:hypothetical protein